MLDRNLLRRIAILEVGLVLPEADCPEPRQCLPPTPAIRPTLCIPPLTAAILFDDRSEGRHPNSAHVRVQRITTGAKPRCPVPVEDTA